MAIDEAVLIYDIFIFQCNFLINTYVNFYGFGDILCIQVNKCSLTEYQS